MSEPSDPYNSSWRTITSMPAQILHGTVTIRTVHRMQGYAAELEPMIEWEGPEPTVTGWEVRILAPYDGKRYPCRHRFECETREQAIERARVYMKALDAIPEREWVNWQEVEVPEPEPVAVPDDDSGWWEKFK